MDGLGRLFLLIFLFDQPRRAANGIENRSFAMTKGSEVVAKTPLINHFCPSRLIIFVVVTLVDSKEGACIS